MMFLERLLDIVMDRFRGDPPYDMQFRTSPDGADRFLVRDGYTLHERPGTKARRLRHQFDSIESMAEWLRNHADPRVTDVFVGEAGIVASPVARDASADILRLTWRWHPQIEPWLAASKRPELSLGDLLRLVRQNSAVIDGDAVALRGALASFSSSKAEEIKVEYGALGEIKAVAVGGGTTVSASFPSEFAIRVIPWIGLRDEGGVDCALRLQVQIESIDGKPRFKLALPDLAERLVRAQHQAATTMAYRLGPAWIVSDGNFATEEYVVGLRPHSEVLCDRVEGNLPTPPQNVPFVGLRYASLAPESSPVDTDSDSEPQPPTDPAGG